MKRLVYAMGLVLITTNIMAALPYPQGYFVITGKFFIENPKNADDVLTTGEPVIPWNVSIIKPNKYISNASQYNGSFYQMFSSGSDPKGWYGIYPEQRYGWDGVGLSYVAVNVVFPPVNKTTTDVTNYGVWNVLDVTTPGISIMSQGTYEPFSFPNIPKATIWDVKDSSSSSVASFPNVTPLEDSLAINTYDNSGAAYLPNPIIYSVPSRMFFYQTDNKASGKPGERLEVQAKAKIMGINKCLGSPDLEGGASIELSDTSVALTLHICSDGVKIVKKGNAAQLPLFPLPLSSGLIKKSTTQEEHTYILVMKPKKVCSSPNCRRISLAVDGYPLATDVEIDLPDATTKSKVRFGDISDKANEISLWSYIKFNTTINVSNNPNW